MGTDYEFNFQTTQFFFKNSEIHFEYLRNSNMIREKKAIFVLNPS